MTRNENNYQKSFLKSLFIIVFFTLLIFPFVQTKFKMIPEKTVRGKIAKLKKPKFHIKNFIDKKYQSSFTNWYSKKIGLRGILIKSNNQLNFSLFKDLNPHNSTKIILGKESYLFEKSYIDNYNRNIVAPIELLKEKILKLEELQALLKKRNMEFLLVISPSKAEIYPEFIPSKYLHPKRLERRDNYEEFLNILKTTNINYIDSISKFKTLKKNSKHPLFTKTGTHWSYFGACLISKEITEKLQILLNKKIPIIKCKPLKNKSSAEGTDRDLLNLTNIWDEKGFAEDIPYPPNTFSSFKLEPQTKSNYRPTVLVEGDSFTWTLLHFFDTQAVFRKRKFYYYYESEYNFWTETKAGKLKKNKSAKFSKGKVTPDWATVLKERDAVVLLANQSIISDLGHGFIDNAIHFLKNSK